MTLTSFSTEKANEPPRPIHGSAISPRESASAHGWRPICPPSDRRLSWAVRCPFFFVSDAVLCMAFLCLLLVTQRNAKKLGNVVTLALRVKRAPAAVDVSRDALEKIPGLNKAVAMCADAAGVQDKTVIADLSYDPKSSVDAATWSRIKSGQASPAWETLDALMTAMGNELPIFWMLHRRGYDPRSLRRYESDIERENRELRELLVKEQQKNDHIAEFFAKARAA